LMGAKKAVRIISLAPSGPLPKRSFSFTRNRPRTHAAAYMKEWQRNEETDLPF